MVSTSLRRRCVAFLISFRLSVRRACELVGISRSSLKYKPRRRDDSKLTGEILKLARKNKRYGYRRIGALLARKGKGVNHKKLFRLWKENRLSLPRKRSRKPRPGTDPVPCRALFRNHVWTYDFVFDALNNGKPVKFLTLIDEFSRLCLKIEVGVSITAKSVISVLMGTFETYGVPKYIRSDNGPEFVAKELRQWLAELNTGAIYIEPGSPWQNAFGESFNGKFRDECLNMNIFYSVADAKRITEKYRRFYNEKRPHSSLAYLTPVEFSFLHSLLWLSLKRGKMSLSLSATPDRQRKKKGRAHGPADPFVDPSRRSGRSPALPYPPDGHLSIYHSSALKDSQ